MLAGDHSSEVVEWDELTLEGKAALGLLSSRGLLEFTKIWYEINRNETFNANWHHRYVCGYIDLLISNKLVPSNLVINIPPGSSKTELLSIHFPAYLCALYRLGKIAKFRNLNISFSDDLVKRNSRRTKGLIGSKEFQELFSLKFGVKKANEWDLVDDDNKPVCENISISAGGQIAGSRAGYQGSQYSGHIMLDDFNKPDDMFSLTKRQQSNRLLVNTIRSRRANKSESYQTPIISIQQRLHINDASGFMLAGSMGLDFFHIKIPALIDDDYTDTIPEPYRGYCLESLKNKPYVKVGGKKYYSYWEDVESVNSLLDLWQKDEYTFLSQYQQSPILLTGNIIDTNWVSRYEVLPELVYRAVFCDTNSGKDGDRHDYSVFTLVGYGVDHNLYVIDAVRGKWDPGDLLDKCIELWEKWLHADSSMLRYMAIEDKQAGQGLITTLQNRRYIPVEAIPRRSGESRLVRCNNVIPQIKMGLLFLPVLYSGVTGNKLTSIKYSDGSYAAPTDWVLIALKEMADFTADDSHKHDDVLDTIVDAIDYVLVDRYTKSGLLDYGL